MNVTNVHRRIIPQTKDKITTLLSTLSSKHDMIWPFEQWPKMKLDQGLNLYSKGGHGPIRYVVSHCDLENKIEFTFIAPKGFVGTHSLIVNELNSKHTIIVHDINMNLRTISAQLNWLFVIRPLHDALIEDAFDKIENNFNFQKKKTKWSIWVIVLRKILK